jgi:DNA-binding transcriptional regulator YdaS (Cro superfamily)
LKNLEGNVNGAYLLARRLDPKATGSAALANRLFPDGVMPPEVNQLILASRKVTAGGEWNRQEANELLQGALKERMEQINQLRRSQYDEYMSGLHEKEAFYVGERARLKSKEAGATEVQPKKKKSELDELEALFPEGFGDDLELQAQW